MNYRALFVAAVAALFGFAAQAVEWSGAQVVTANVEDDVELLDQVEVTVASGSTFAINGNISGSGSIKLVGGGTLQLAVSNDFSGGAYIDTGVLQVLTGGALGTGDITVKGGTTATSQLKFGELDASVTGNKTITFSNNITIEHGGDLSHFVLAFGPHNATQGNRKYLELSGNIICLEGDFYLDMANTYNNTASRPQMHVYGDICVVDGIIYIRRLTHPLYFYGKVTAKDILQDGEYGSYRLGLKSQDNCIDQISLSRGGVECLQANVLGGAAMNYVYNQTANRTVTELTMGSYSQKIAYLKTSNYTASSAKTYLPIVTATTDATLTLTGGVAAATFEGRLGTTVTDNNISLVIDANEDFTQTVSGANNMLNGSIAVKKGTLVFSGADALPNVSAIEVASGAAFKLTAPEIADEKAFPDASVEMSLGATGFVDLNGRKVTVASMTIDGVDMDGKTLTHTTNPDNIAEGTEITVLELFKPEIKVDKTKNGDWIVNVPEGETVTVLAAQTGSGHIQKTGPGELILAAASTFTGGIQIDEGIVTVAAVGALGSGEIDIAGSTVEDCQLRIDTTRVGATQTISNPIVLQGNSASTHPAIYFVLPTTAESGTPWTVTFTGGITANGDLYLGDTHGGATGAANSGKDWDGKMWVVFDCPINAAGYRLQYGDRPTDKDDWQGPCGNVYFNGAVTAATFSVYGYTGTSYGSAGSIYFASDENAIDDFAAGYNFVSLTAPEALGDARVNITRSTGSARSIIYLSADQHVRSLTSVAFKNTKTVAFNATSASTLTFDGAEADGGKTAVVGFKGALSIVVDAREDGFVQTFKDRGDDDNTMTGSITVKRGTLKITGGSSFKSVSAIDVRGGALEVDTTLADCFAGATALSVMNGGTLTVNRADVFTKPPTLKLESGAVLNWPSGTTLDVAGFIYNGMSRPKGSYSKTDIPELPEGVTLNVTAEAVVDAEWTGAGEDALTTTLANWLVDGKVPAGVNLKDGLMNVTLKGGTGLTYADGDTFNNIVNDLPVVDEQAEVKKVLPFYIRPATEGATLTVKGNVTSDGKGQLVLSGHLAGGANSTFTYTPAVVGTGTNYIESAKDSFSKGAAALGLKGVTIDMNLKVGRASGTTMFFATGGTTNVVNGKMTFKNNAAYASVDSGSVVIFRGGLSTDNSYMFYGKGEWQVVDVPADRFDAGLRINGQARFVFGVSNNIVTGNKTREGIVVTSGTIDMRCNDCFTDETQITPNAANSMVRLEFNSTTQALGRVNLAINDDNTSSYLNGDYSSVLEMTCKIRPGAWSYPQYIKTPYCNARVTGGVGFHMNDQDGGTNVFTLAGRDFESCGDLVVSAGTLELANDATWLNGTNFTAKGTGVLKFGKQGQVNAGFATIHLADDGKLFIPDGVTVVVPAADLDNAALDRGVYTGADGVLKDRILGGGALKVGKRGMAVLIQ